MSQRDKPATGWTTAAWSAGVACVYVLMLGPVDGLQSAHRLPEPLAIGFRWLYAPLAWAIAFAPEPVHQVFVWYVRFWVEVFKR